MKVLIVSADGFEDTELLEPARRLRAREIAVEIASPQAGVLTGKHGGRVAVDRTIAGPRAADYDALLLPGGLAPAGLCRDAAVLQLAREFAMQDKPIAAICHGPQILAAAGVLRGRRATAHPTVAETLRAAGAVYEDSEVVVDGRLVTSRRPADLPAFIEALSRLLGRT